MSKNKNLESVQSKVDRILRHPYWTAIGVVVAILAIFVSIPKSVSEDELLCRYAGAKMLGWPGSGHKTNFCKNAGFDQGNFNIPGSGYDAGGVCIDIASEPCHSDYLAKPVPEGVTCRAIDGIKHCFRSAP